MAYPQLVAGDSLTLTATTHSSNVIADLFTGEVTPIKSIMISTNASASCRIAVGASTINAQTAPLFAITNDSGPIILNVIGMTHIAFYPASDSYVVVSQVE